MPNEEENSGFLLGVMIGMAVASVAFLTLFEKDRDELISAIKAKLTTTVDTKAKPKKSRARV